MPKINNGKGKEKNDNEHWQNFLQSLCSDKSLSLSYLILGSTSNSHTISNYTSQWYGHLKRRGKLHTVLKSLKIIDFPESIK